MLADQSNHFTIYVRQIIVLSTLNSRSAACQLYLNEAGKKKFSGMYL